MVRPVAFLGTVILSVQCHHVVSWELIAPPPGWPCGGEDRVAWWRECLGTPGWGQPTSQHRAHLRWPLTVSKGDPGGTWPQGWYGSDDVASETGGPSHLPAACVPSRDLRWEGETGRTRSQAAPRWSGPGWGPVCSQAAPSAEGLPWDCVGHERWSVLGAQRAQDRLLWAGGLCTRP